MLIGLHIKVQNSKETARVIGRPFPKGVSGNPGGRPKGTMKNYLSRKFMEMSDEEKEAFLIEHKVMGKDQIEFGEGKARQDLEIDATVSGPSIIRLNE